MSDVSGQNTSQIIYYNNWKMTFLECLKRADLECMQNTCLSALHIYSDKQLVEATWLRARESVFSCTYGSQMHWKWNETARCYRARAMLTCHWRRSMDWATVPNESCATNGANKSHKCGALSSSDVVRKWRLLCRAGVLSICATLSDFATSHSNSG